MIDNEQDRFERELRELIPAKLPHEFSERLNQAWNPGNPVPTPRRCERPDWLRWLAPAAAAVAAALTIIAHSRLLTSHNETPSKRPDGPALIANDVEIDRRLLASFDAVATLPGGEPVQVECREWMDQVVLRDTTHGVAIQQNTPRFEIVPVNFETF